MKNILFSLTLLLPFSSFAVEPTDLMKPLLTDGGKVCEVRIGSVAPFSDVSVMYTCNRETALRDLLELEDMSIEQVKILIIEEMLSQKYSLISTQLAYSHTNMAALTFVKQ